MGLWQRRELVKLGLGVDKVGAGVESDTHVIVDVVTRGRCAPATTELLAGYRRPSPKHTITVFLWTNRTPLPPP